MAQFTDRPRFDIICVGDVATDIYVAMPDEQTKVVDEGGTEWLAMPFGAKIPFARSVTVEAGGNASNAAVACTRLGLRVALASYLGADQLGRDMLAALHGEGIDTSLVHLDPTAPTNRHFVLWRGGERTILVHHEEYDYHWPHLRPSEIPAWLYLSSVGEHADAYQTEIADWLDANPSVDLAIEPGTYQIARGASRLARLYRRSSLLICNREEAATIVGSTSTDDVDMLLGGLQALGPRRVVITDSVTGAYAADGAERYEAPVYPDEMPIVDRTGAGDAYAATLLAYLIQGMSLEDALLRAAVNAASVVHALGTQAGLLRSNQVESYLQPAPAHFAVRATHDLSGGHARVSR